MKRSLTIPTVILTVVVLIVGCTSGDDTAEEPTTAAPVTTVAPAATVAATTEATTTTTPPTSSQVVASFDGERWSYGGPDQVTATEPLLLSFTNESDVIAGVDIESRMSRCVRVGWTGLGWVTRLVGRLVSGHTVR